MNIANILKNLNLKKLSKCLININKILIINIFVGFYSCLATTNPNKSKITDLKNIAKCTVTIKDDKKFINISGENKNINLQVPFISINNNPENLINFTRSINYIPKGALKIITCAGKFGIWEDESGINCTKKIKNNFEEKISQKLKLNLTQKELLIIKLLLSINHEGVPNLEIK